MLLQMIFKRFVREGFASGQTAAAGLVILVSALCLSGNTMAATPANAKSPLGINLMEMNYFNPEQPFLNIFKTSGVTRSTPTGWYTHAGGTFDTHEQAYLQLDANGYPTTLTASSAVPHSPQLFTSVGVLLERELPHANGGTGLPYRAGRYVVLYDGQGTLEYTFDARLVSSSPGRDVINVSPSDNGISLSITATDPNHNGNYIRNIRVVKAEEESLLAAGNVFEPNFLSLMQNFHVLRAMQWLDIDADGGSLTNWADRPHPADAGWGGAHGVPIDTVLQLCNSVGADCWLNVPHQANNDYITQMATLAHANLNPSQKIYIEFSNEVWNWVFGQSQYAVAQGKLIWPNAGVGDGAYNLNWYGMRTAQMCDMWKSVWGADSSRVVCVMGAQGANPDTAKQSLDCPLWTGPGNAPCSNHNINAVAIAPYFGNRKAQKSWMAAADGGNTQLFQDLGGDVAQSAGFEAAYKKLLAPYHLPLIAYEGGQSFQSFDPDITNLYIAANRDPRMAASYATALKDWKANDGEIYVIFADIYGPGKYGVWGALESFMDTVSPLDKAPPKWQAIQSFISGNPCWWPGCTGTIGPTTATPTAPVLSVK